MQHPTEQEGQRLEEIRRLLLERERYFRKWMDLDAQLAIIAGLDRETRPQGRSELNKDEFLRACRGRP